MLGITLTDERSTTGSTTSTADLAASSRTAEITTSTAEPTEFVATVNVLLVVPAGTVTPVGTVAIAGSLLESATLRPPGGAGVARVTVAIAELPPATRV